MSTDILISFFLLHKILLFVFLKILDVNDFCVPSDATAAAHSHSLCIHTFVVADKPILELSLAAEAK